MSLSDHLSKVILATALLSSFSCTGFGDEWKKIEEARNKGQGSNRLVISGPTNLSPGCNGPYTLQVENSSGTPVAQSSSLTVNVATDASVNGTNGFHTTAGCPSVVSQITINAGATNVSFYYYETCQAGPFTLTISGPGLENKVFVVNGPNSC